MLLRVVETDAYYGRAQALHQITLEVDHGEIVALLGANGAGKSTTLLMISGLVRPQTGEDPVSRKADSSREALCHCETGCIALSRGKGALPGHDG